MVAACAARSVRGLGAFVGCWALEQRSGPIGTLGTEMPDTIRLDSTVNRNPDGRPHPYFPLELEVLSLRARVRPDSIRLDETHYAPWPPEWRRYYAQTAWRFASPDSAYLNFHANMSGSWNLRLIIGHDSLIGEAEFYSDATPPSPIIIPIRASRTPCRPPSGKPPYKR